MSMTTYTEIADKLVKWLNRESFTSLTDQSEDLIAMAQRRIFRECDLNAMEEVDSAFTIDSQTESVPADFQRVKSITIQQNTSNYPINGAAVQKVLQRGASARPDYYAVVGTNFYFGPPPDQSYTAILMYYKNLDVISTTTATNWLSLNVPELILYGAMLEAALFLKDDQRAAVWGGRYEQTKNDLMKAEDRMDKEAGGLRVRTV